MSLYVGIFSMIELAQAMLVVPVAIHLFGSATFHLFSLFISSEELDEKGLRPVVDLVRWLKNATGTLALYCIGALFVLVLVSRVF